MTGRDISWRQGQVLAHESAVALGLLNAGNTKDKAVIISHDCDLASGELIVELIIAAVIESPDRQKEYARHPRTLHLPYSENQGSTIFLELNHATHRTLSKSEFRKTAERCEELALQEDNKRILKQWLAARYGRPVFPEAFETRLKKKKGKYDCKTLLEKIIGPSHQHIDGVFFDLGTDRGLELEDEVPYVLNILISYDAVAGGTPARAAAEEVASKIGTIFKEIFGESPDDILLERCTAVSNTEITFADLMRMDLWRIEYMSLEDPEGEHFGLVR